MVSDFVVVWGRQRKWCCGIAGCEGSCRKRFGERLASRHRYFASWPPGVASTGRDTTQSGQMAGSDAPVRAPGLKERIQEARGRRGG